MTAGCICAGEICQPERLRYRCARCHLSFPWCCGCGDDLVEFCDTCWEVMDLLAAQLATLRAEARPHA